MHRGARSHQPNDQHSPPVTNDDASEGSKERVYQATPPVEPAELEGRIIRRGSQLGVPSPPPTIPRTGPNEELKSKNSSSMADRKKRNGDPAAPALRHRTPGAQATTTPFQKAKWSLISFAASLGSG